MRKFTSLVLAIVFLFSFVSCDNSSETNNDNFENSSMVNSVTPEFEYTIDFEDAESFETALNNGEKVNGKIVQFDVVEYKPKSAMGINCWSGEHLNFISEKELDVEKGDIIIGQITKEPTKTLGSWKIPYSPLVIDDEKVAKPKEENNIESEESTNNSIDTDNTNSSTPSTDAENTQSTTPPQDIYFVFGNYEQDGDSNNGSEPIEWIILEEQENKILLISRYILDYQDFNDTTIAKGTSWGNSTLRKWLNNDFFNSAFSLSEQGKILLTNVQDYKPNDVLGKITSDKVFILNKDQAFSYFKNDYDRATTSTNYANTHKSYVTNAYWLINSYSSDLYKYLINSDGRNENNPRVNESDGVRPVIWIEK